MAFVGKPAATLSFTWLDASGSKGQTHINVPFGTSSTAVILAADALRPLLASISDARIIGQTLTYEYGNTDPGDPVAGSRIEEKGYFSWRLDNARITSFTVPAIKDDTLLLNGEIDLTDVNIAALVAGVTAIDSIFCGADGSDIDSLLRAYQRFNRTTKNQKP